MSHSEAETKKYAQDFILNVISDGEHRNHALVINLEGNLGSGKTTFSQGVGKALGIKQAIKSPTFVIMRAYDLNNPNFSHLHHFDCYRVGDPQEIIDLGWFDLLSNPKNIILLEWGSRVQSLLPADTKNIAFAHVSPEERSITGL